MGDSTLITAAQLAAAQQHLNNLAGLNTTDSTSDPVKQARLFLQALQNQHFPLPLRSYPQYHSRHLTPEIAFTMVYVLPLYFLLRMAISTMTAPNNLMESSKVLSLPIPIAFYIVLNASTYLLVYDSVDRLVKSTKETLSTLSATTPIQFARDNPAFSLSLLALVIALPTANDPFQALLIAFSVFSLLKSVGLEASEQSNTLTWQGCRNSVSQLLQSPMTIFASNPAHTDTTHLNTRPLLTTLNFEQLNAAELMQVLCDAFHLQKPAATSVMAPVSP